MKTPSRSEVTQLLQAWSDGDRILTVIRDWNFARAWLLAEMSGKNKDIK